MSDNMRWRYGETNPVIIPVNSASVIEIGDLVYLDTSGGLVIISPAEPDELVARLQARLDRASH